jgi:hypothetical protein
MLRRLMQTQPTWTQQNYADVIGRSVAWVKKWTKRLRAAPPDDLAVLHSHSCTRTHPPPKLHQAVIDRLLEIRSAPPTPHPERCGNSASRTCPRCLPTGYPLGTGKRHQVVA